MSPSQPNSVLPSQLMYKNRLQEYTQKSALPLPIYHNTNEGFPHAPKFRSTVLVGGDKYTSNQTFLHRKAAEQEAARLALECIAKRKKDEGHPFSLQDALVCKSILNEFAFKSNRKLPTYNTRSKGQPPVFISSVAFDGKTWTGEVAGSRKMAEQLAAQSAILAILGSNLGDSLREIIESKHNTRSSLHAVNCEGFEKRKSSEASQPRECSSLRPSAEAFLKESVSNTLVSISNTNMQTKRKPELNLDEGCEKRKLLKASQPESWRPPRITPGNVAFSKPCSRMRA